MIHLQSEYNLFVDETKDETEKVYYICVQAEENTDTSYQSHFVVKLCYVEGKNFHRIKTQQLMVLDSC
jgi:hypothetical protein